MAGANVADYLYPLDITGYAATNKVVTERHTLNPPPRPEENDGEITFHFILPFATPFYRDSVVLRHIATGQVLTRGVHYAVGHKFIDATNETEGARGGIYGSVMFYDRALSGQVQFDSYQTLGGEWTLNENKILEILSNRMTDPRTVSYEQVSGKPNVFPPLPHDHDVNDVTGAKELIAANYEISAAIREQTAAWMANPPLLLSEYFTRDEVTALLEAKPFETVRRMGNAVTGNQVIDCIASDVIYATVSGPVNWTFTNRPSTPTAAIYLELRLTNGGRFAQTFPAGTRFPYGDKGLSVNGTDKLIIMLSSDTIDITPIREMT